MTKEELQAAMEESRQQFDKLTIQQQETNQELFRLQGEYRVYEKQLASLGGQTQVPEEAQVIEEPVGEPANG